MQLVPVLEIRHGKGVHTRPKNNFVDEVVKEDAMQVVTGWYQEGVRRIHVVDVDAVESGEPENVDLIAKIKQTYPDLSLQVIGGIKCIESAYVWIDAGADFLVLNGKAIRQRNLLDDICVEFPNRVLVEIDCRRGQVGVNGQTLTHLAQQLEDDGVVGLVVTDVANHNGEVNAGLASISELSSAIEIPVFANGVVDKLDDLKRLLDSQSAKPSGVLVGKAIYNGGIRLNEANSMLAQYQEAS
ncbi:hypothetical protein FLL45_18820 [Aliikangiella marina]|uniref:1-(5-phosphoribosyl)-5-((5-phosphoribosylamino)methylideneamino)imidazole-4-carboxamide isomerase n=1 Tax=Aliikangiella marina TaxID=1712262 RepID=A0A545T4X8_9GAMM|nr:HisA/HisF-related TIM barrel protein [Aliikangiella marina]TQV72273.1 hypothetical protein FLL45_18820 [Aliikangiella marina]